MEKDSPSTSSDEEREGSPPPEAEIMELQDYCRKVQAPPHLHRPIYSRVLKYLEMDFLNCSLPMVIAATADFRIRPGLSAAMNLELQNHEFLFSQRCQVGEVASMPRFSSRTHRRVYYLVLRTSEQATITVNDAENCVYDLFCRTKTNGETCLAVSLVDKWRDPIR